MTTVICRYCMCSVRAYVVSVMDAKPVQHYTSNGAICPGSIRTQRR